MWNEKKGKIGGKKIAKGMKRKKSKNTQNEKLTEKMVWGWG